MESWKPGKLKEVIETSWNVNMTKSSNGIWDQLLTFTTFAPGFCQIYVCFIDIETIKLNIISDSFHKK